MVLVTLASKGQSFHYKTRTLYCTNLLCPWAQARGLGDGLAGRVLLVRWSVLRSCAQAPGKGTSCLGPEACRHWGRERPCLAGTAIAFVCRYRFSGHLCLFHQMRKQCHRDVRPGQSAYGVGLVWASRCSEELFPPHSSCWAGGSGQPQFSHMETEGTG